jgi:NAD(P)-dependent dehydrogenase (short-subunit alcohol dehydrogenase family)
LHLAASGHTVYGTVRSLDKATTLNAMADAAGVELNLVELDIADDDSVRDGLGRVLAEAGRIDVLVNNAGVGGNGVVEEAPVELYDEVMNVNLYGAIRCLKAVLPGMRERRAARS